MGVAQQQQQSSAELWGEWLASRRAGQLMFRGVDSVMRLVEKTLIWSSQVSSKPVVGPDAELVSECCHGHVTETQSPQGQGAQAAQIPSLVVVARPLSWPLLLPLLGMLGAVRVSVFCVSRLFRRPCDTTDIIHWLQSKRRKLRVIKYAGIKNMRQQSKLVRTPTSTPCKKSPQTSTTPEQERKRKYDDVEQSDWTDESDDESVAVKLDKCDEDYDSEADPDFVPNTDSESSDEDSAASEDEDIEGGAVLVNGSDLSPTSHATPKTATSPSIVVVETPDSVSDYGSASTKSPSSLGSSVVSTPASPRSKFVKFFRRSIKTKQQS